MAGFSTVAAESSDLAADTPHLTRREVEVLVLVAQGFTSREVADQLFVSKRTIDFHLDGIYGKLHVANRMQAIREAERRGLLNQSEVASA